MMRREIKTLCLLAVGCLCLAQMLYPFLAEVANSGEVVVHPQISVEDLMVLQSESPEVLILDVRAPLLYKMGHIPTAISVPQSEWNGNRLAEITANHQQIVVYCSGPGCDDSKKVAQLLTDQGGQSVRVLVSGWAGWQAYRERMNKGAPDER